MDIIPLSEAWKHILQDLPADPNVRFGGTLLDLGGQKFRADTIRNIPTPVPINEKRESDEMALLKKLMAAKGGAKPGGPPPGPAPGPGGPPQAPRLALDASHGIKF